MIDQEFAFRLLLAIVLGGALVFLGYVTNTRRWRTYLEQRFILGIPWGTVLTVGIVVSFYLFAQNGLTEWGDPLFLPFVSWSYLYPTGMLTAGIAHVSSGHLLSNMVITLVLGPVAEFAWSHYPSAVRDDGTSGDDDDGKSGDETGGKTNDRAQFEDEPTAESVNEHRIKIPDGGKAPLRHRPWVRAFVLFPAILLLFSVATSIFSVGPGLGFSGVVFAIVGFTLITYPVTTIIGVLTASALNVIYMAFTQPIVRATIESAPPSPPAWAGIGFQAHLFGFLVGATVGVLLCRYRRQTPSFERLFVAMAIVGLAQSLWLLVWTVDDVFILYTALGVVLVIGLTVLITVAAAGSDRPLIGTTTGSTRTPSRQTLARIWLTIVLLGIGLSLVGAAVLEDVPWLVGAVLAFIALILAIPAIPTVLPDRIHAGPLSRRQGALTGLLIVVLLVGIPAVPIGLVTVDGTVPGEGEVEVGDYVLTYESNVTPGQTLLIDRNASDEMTNDTASGVIVTSDDRQLWTVGVRPETLEHRGNDSVTVGGLGWRETVTVERSGWNVVGNDTAYAINLTVDNETTRSYESDPIRAEATITGHTIDIVPTSDGFDLRVTETDGDVHTGSLPGANGSRKIGELHVQHDVDDEAPRLVVSVDETTVTIATKETY